MASITIPELEAELDEKLRARAAEQGRSIEEEAREILRSALVAGPPPATDLAEAIRRRFAPLNGVELSPATRTPLREPPDFEQ